MSRVIPCVLMRAGTSRGPFFLREWLPSGEAARDEALIGAIGASDLLQVADKEIQKRIEEHGASVSTGTPAELGALVKSELVKWKSVVQRAKLTAD